MSNQGLRQASARALYGGSADVPYAEDFMRLFTAESIPDGTFNERLLRWINARFSASYVNLSDAQAAAAASIGLSSWGDITSLAEVGSFTESFTTALPSTVTYSRSGTSTALTNSGAVQVFAPNVAPITDRGMLVEAASTNRYLNSILAGGVSGTPGTAPTSWTQFVVNAPTATYTADSAYSGGSRVRVQVGATDRFQLGQTEAVAAGAVRVNSIWATVTTGIGIQNMVSFSAIPAGSTVSYFIDGSPVTATTIPSAGLRFLACVLTVGGTAGNANARIGLGIMGAGAAGDVTFDRPQVETLSSPTSYIPTTTTTATRGLPTITRNVPSGKTTARATYRLSSTVTDITGLTPGASFDLVTGRPWTNLGNELKSIQWRV